MNELEAEFIFKVMTIIGALHLVMFAIISYFLKGIYENTNALNTNQVRTTEKSSSNTKRIDKLDAEYLELNRSMHDFRDDIGKRVGIIEYRMTEKDQ